MTMVTGARAIDHAAKLDIFRIAVVTTVTAWKHGVSLGFNDSALAINLEGEVELRCAGASVSYPADDRIALAKRLLDFLGRHVTVATVGADGALTLIFENGAAAPGSIRLRELHHLPARRNNPCGLRASRTHKAHD